MGYNAAKKIMKKIIGMLIVFMGLSLNIMGQTASCKISGGPDGATVVASIAEIGNGYVMVTVENDGSFDVNVTITIQHTSLTSIYQAWQ